MTTRAFAETQYRVSSQRKGTQMTTHETIDRPEAMTTQEWLAIRKEAGLKIDPETAKVTWEWGLVLDPYGVLEIEEDGRCIGRSYFARAPENDIWVSFHDLPAEIVSALWNKVDANAYYDDWLLDV
jgi:hypothetical protein